MLVVADDLTGAADTAAAFAIGGHRSIVVLQDRPIARVRPAGLGDDAADRTDIIAIDTDARTMSADAAGEVTAAAVRSRPGDQLFLKIDSTLRGHLRAMLTAAAGELGGTHRVVICPAFPALGRTVVGGIVHVDGRALADGDIGALLTGIDCADDIRVVDASTEQDLDAIVRADDDPGIGDGRMTMWVGSAGLARALGRARTTSGTHRVERRPSERIVVVVGSQHERTAAQMARVRADTRLVQIDPRDHTHVDEIMPMLRQADGLVLTGGHTARVVLDALGVTTIQVGGEVEVGAPWSVAHRHGRSLSIVTKAGGFGSDLVLRQAVQFLEQP